MQFARVYRAYHAARAAHYRTAASRHNGHVAAHRRAFGYNIAVLVKLGEIGYRGGYHRGGVRARAAQTARKRYVFAHRHVRAEPRQIPPQKPHRFSHRVFFGNFAQLVAREKPRLDFAAPIETHANIVVQVNARHHAFESMQLPERARYVKRQIYFCVRSKLNAFHFSIARHAAPNMPASLPSVAFKICTGA